MASNTPSLRAPLPWRTALVTGASSGIGEALSERLARDGVEVVLAARRLEKLEALASKLEASGAKARPLRLDVTRTEETVEAIRRVDDEVGGLDLIVANAGLGRPQSARTLTWENTSEVFAINFMGAMATLTAVLPRMIERGRGHLVGMSSLVVYAPTPGAAAYRASKSGLTALLENLRAELGNTGVSATAIHPGYVETPMADNFRTRGPDGELLPAKRPPVIVSAEDAASLIVGRLRKAPARIDFPFSLMMMIKSVGALPELVQGAIVRKMSAAVTE